MTTAYTNYNGSTDPTSVPGTTASALYNVPPDMAAIVVKLTPSPKQHPDVGMANKLDKDGKVIEVPGSTSIETPEYKTWKDQDLVHYDSMLAKMGLMDGADRGKWQKRMWDAGMYKKTQTFTSEAYDEETQSAWAEVVERAAKQQKSVTEVLDEGAKDVADAGGVDKYYKKAKGAAGGVQPLVTHLTSAVDIGVVAQEVAQKRIGRYLTKDELDRFSQVYHGQESGYQAADYNQGQAGGPGGTATQAPSIQAAAQQFAEAAHPVEAGAQRQVELFKKIADMFTQGPQGVSQTGI